MQRQRGELVPVGKIIGSLSGPVQAIRKTPPPARRGFTLADQVNQLVSASEADPERGFMARTMALCSLPRSNPGNQLLYKRVNGPYRLYMQAGPETKLPFGNFPRLLLAWVSTEAVRTQSRELILGPSLTKFMKTLGVYSSGGGNVHTKLRNQMKRLFGPEPEFASWASARSVTRSWTSFSKLMLSRTTWTRTDLGIRRLSGVPRFPASQGVLRAATYDGTARQGGACAPCRCAGQEHEADGAGRAGA